MSRKLLNVLSLVCFILWVLYILLMQTTSELYNKTHKYEMVYDFSNEKYAQIGYKNIEEGNWLAIESTWSVLNHASKLIIMLNIPLTGYLIITRLKRTAPTLTN